MNTRVSFWALLAILSGATPALAFDCADRILGAADADMTTAH